MVSGLSTPSFDTRQCHAGSTHHQDERRERRGEPDDVPQQRGSAFVQDEPDSADEQNRNRYGKNPKNDVQSGLLTNWKQPERHQDPDDRQPQMQSRLESSPSERVVQDITQAPLDILAFGKRPQGIFTGRMRQ